MFAGGGYFWVGHGQQVTVTTVDDDGKKRTTTLTCKDGYWTELRRDPRFAHAVPITAIGTLAPLGA